MIGNSTPKYVYISFQLYSNSNRMLTRNFKIRRVRTEFPLSHEFEIQDPVHCTFQWHQCESLSCQVDWVYCEHLVRFLCSCVLENNQDGDQMFVCIYVCLFKIFFKSYWTKLKKSILKFFYYYIYFWCFALNVVLLL